MVQTEYVVRVCTDARIGSRAGRDVHFAALRRTVGVRFRFGEPSPTFSVEPRILPELALLQSESTLDASI